MKTFSILTLLFYSFCAQAQTQTVTLNHYEPNGNGHVIDNLVIDFTFTRDSNNMDYYKVISTPRNYKHSYKYNGKIYRASDLHIPNDTEKNKLIDKHFWSHITFFKIFFSNGYSTPANTTRGSSEQSMVQGDCKVIRIEGDNSHQMINTHIEGWIKESLNPKKSVSKATQKEATINYSGTSSNSYSQQQPKSKQQSQLQSLENKRLKMVQTNQVISDGIDATVNIVGGIVSGIAKKREIRLKRELKLINAGSPRDNQGRKHGEWKTYYEHKNWEIETITTYVSGVKQGKYKSLFLGGETEWEGMYVNNKKVGEWRYYGWDGDLCMTVTYDNGLLNGKIHTICKGITFGLKFNKDVGTYHTFTGNFLNGRKNGVWQFFRAKKRKDTNAFISSNGVYSNNIRQGTWYFINKKENLIIYKIYNENGRLIEFLSYNLLPNREKGKRSGKYKLYHKNGELKIIAEYLEGKLIGVYKSYHENGQLNQKGKHLDGEITGEWKTYTENGTLHEISNYLNAKLTGIFISYHENGELKITGEYLEGDTTGEWKSYYESGKLKSLENYSNGKRFGAYKSYYENGTLEQEGAYLDVTATGEWKFYHNNGKLSDIGNYSNGNRTGKWKAYYKNGELKDIGYYLEGRLSDEWKFYHDNGKLNEIINYLDNKLNGEWKKYHENGKLKGIGKHDDGKKIGEWKFYHDNEQLKRIGIYSNGKGNGEWLDYYRNGQLHKKGNYLQSKKTGEWKFYNDNGQLHQIGKYIDGKPNGDWKTYYKNGVLMNKGNYSNGKKTGEWQYYHENDKIHQIKLWKGNKLMEIISCFDGQGNPLDKGTIKNGNGTVKEYDVDGKLTKVKEYLDGLLYNWNKYKSLNTIAWHYYENYSDDKHINTAISFVERSIELNENYYNCDTYAHLLYKTNKSSAALKMAEKAIKLAKDQGVSNSKSTKDLIVLINM